MSNSDDECPGAGVCHGCLMWCSTCGDVAHVCDTRLSGKRCDEHPVPPAWQELRKARRKAESDIDKARRALREAQEAMEAIVDSENARREFDKQESERDRKLWVMP